MFLEDDDSSLRRNDLESSNSLDDTNLMEEIRSPMAEKKRLATLNPLNTFQKNVARYFNAKIAAVKCFIKNGGKGNGSDREEADSSFTSKVSKNEKKGKRMEVHCREKISNKNAANSKYKRKSKRGTRAFPRGSGRLSCATEKPPRARNFDSGNKSDHEQDCLTRKKNIKRHILMRNARKFGEILRFSPGSSIVPCQCNWNIIGCPGGQPGGSSQASGGGASSSSSSSGGKNTSSTSGGQHSGQRRGNSSGGGSSGNSGGGGNNNGAQASKITMR